MIIIYKRLYFTSTYHLKQLSKIKLHRKSFFVSIHTNMTVKKTLYQESWKRLKRWTRIKTCKTSSYWKLKRDIKVLTFKIVLISLEAMLHTVGVWLVVIMHQVPNSSVMKHVSCSTLLRTWDLMQEREWNTGNTQRKTK